MVNSILRTEGGKLIDVNLTEMIYISLQPTIVYTYS